MSVEFHNFVAMNGDPATVDAFLEELHRQFDLPSDPDFWKQAARAAEAERDYLPVRSITRGSEFLFTTKHRHVGSLCSRFHSRNQEAAIELWLGRSHQLTFHNRRWGCVRHPQLHTIAAGTCADYDDRRLEPEIVCDLQAFGLWTDGPIDVEKLMES